MTGPNLDEDPRVQAGLDALQRAAREVISASRAFLDVAEELVEDPKAAAGIADLLGTVAGRIARNPQVARFGFDDAAPGEGTDGDDDGPTIQRIPVS